MDFANRLIKKNMHLIGTLRINLKKSLNEMTTTKLKRGEVIAKENSNEIIVLKWKNKRNVWSFLRKILAKW